MTTDDITHVRDHALALQAGEGLRPTSKNDRGALPPLSPPLMITPSPRSLAEPQLAIRNCVDQAMPIEVKVLLELSWCRSVLSFLRRPSEVLEIHCG